MHGAIESAPGLLAAQLRVRLVGRIGFLLSSLFLYLKNTVLKNFVEF